MLTNFALEHYGLISTLEALAVFFGMLLCMEAGRRLALKKGALEDSPGAGAIEGAVFALLGLLIAFTFAGAYSRVEARNLAAIKEANAIGTAYMRLDLLPPAAGAKLKPLLRDYTAARTEEYKVIRNTEDHARAREHTAGLKKALWKEALEICRKETYPQAAQLLLPALNETFDGADSREFMRQIHPPRAVYGLLFAIAMLSATLAGHRMADKKGRSWLHRLSFAAATAITIFVTLNLEHPLFGLLGREALRLPLETALSDISK
ncbi:MAG: hypothetical protein PHV36_07760 [Elusimicrobiales bacterium]|nr:hypothetical protein [Elusimicrobiales bacterium]